MDKIHIALAFCDPKGTYCQHAAVTIASVFENTKSHVCVHILHDATLTDENRAKLEELAENFKQEIEFINVNPFLDEDKIDVSKLSSDGHKGTVFRLLFPEISPEDKMIYLDCDIVVTLDIAELWNIDLQDKTIGAVRDVHSLEYLEGKKEWPRRRGRIWNMLGIAKGDYFNAGVLVINLEKLRKEYDFLNAVENFYTEYGKCITFADQDCLNAIFANDKILLEERFNCMRTDFTGKMGRIWHFSHYKPWECYTRQGTDELYWQYLRKTPYCKNEAELITNMLKNLGSSKYVHTHSSDCIKNIRQHIKAEMRTAHIFADLNMWLLKLKSYF